MLKRNIEEELLAFCSEKGIGVLAYSPMHRGLLTGKFSLERLEKMAPDDHRPRSPDFKQPRFSSILSLVEKLKPIAARSDKSLAQLAISWVTRRPEVTSAIVGSRSPEQIGETADYRQLSEQDIAETEELLKNF